MYQKTVAMDRSKWIRRAVFLSWLTIGYNVIEGLVSIGYGISEESVALAGFGADSWVEVASALIVLWRFRGEEGEGTPLSNERERKATIAIGALFVVLAATTLAASLLQLSQGSRPQTTMPGLVISLLSLSFMYFLWSSKKTVGALLGSSTVLKDAACSLACIKLSFTLFVGSLIALVFPALGWMDAVAALVIAGLIGQEGVQTIRAARQPDFQGGCGCNHCG